jgi:hypothetical protein
MLKIIYSFFLGILLAIFVGMGIAAFYQQPASPTWPTELNVANKEQTAEQQKLQKDFDAKQAVWNEKMKPYNRNVSIMTLAAAVVFVAIGLLLEQKINILADGIMLGGVFTLLYSMGRGFASQNSKYSFVVVSIGVAIAIALGYLRFVKLDGFADKPKTKA